ncbi:uncharacterized protein [Rutidosis leptorrhynchoides]|uniref:uncharacterized protein n=1 Tax=Rutidosis leptorrhynchoides TaxID=125765 RepID=UPI003A99B163
MIGLIMWSYSNKSSQMILKGFEMEKELCKQFFSVDKIEKEDKVRIASIHMLGKALIWHQNYVKIHGEDVEWNLYEEAILKRFGTSIEDPLADLKNLRQTGSIQVYYDEFEKLLIKVDISLEQAISLFLAGLQKEIELQVRMFRPKSLEDAFGLAKLQEDTIATTKRRYSSLLPTPKTVNNTYSKSTTYTPYTTSVNKNVTTPHTTTQLALPSPTYTSRNNSRKLTHKELEEKRLKGLCFYCDQKYVPGHKCSGQVFSLDVIGEGCMNDDSVGTELEENEHFSDANDTYLDETPQISLNALTGTSAYQTMRITGHVKKQRVHILIDSGSTHNFLDIEMAKRLGCQLKDIAPVQVMVPGGHKITTTKFCNFEWRLSDAVFNSSMVVIPLGGCDMVLGIQWLSTLGEIRWNFEKLVMTFSHNNRKVELRCTKKPLTQWIEGRKMVKSLGQHQAQLSSMFLYVYPVALCNMTVDKVDNNDKGKIHPRIELLLSQFEDIFAAPTELPPRRAHDHRIPLKEGTQPINVRPYRHPPTQKNSIEEMVGELLGTGVIRPSQSPFSAPIVMVKKKHGSWRMCVDYRKLN